MQKKLNQILLIPLFVISGLLCNNNVQTKIIQKDKDSIVIDPNIRVSFKRDSLYLIYTINSYRKLSYYNFKIDDIYKGYEEDKMPNWVDTIIYSQDNLKMFAFIINAFPSVAGENKGSILYGGRDFIGFRDSITQPWHLYYFEQFIPSGFQSYADVQLLFRQHYFHDFKDEWRNVFKDGNREKTYFSYNINDSNFWTKSFVWQKGYSIKGYYYFQLRKDFELNDPNPEKDQPLIIYPDSILEMFYKFN